MSKSQRAGLAMMLVGIEALVAAPHINQALEPYAALVGTCWLLPVGALLLTFSKS